MNYYLNYNIYSSIDNHCSKRCLECVSNKAKTVDFRRGEYKGYLYAKKLNKHLYNKTKSPKIIYLYNHLKVQRTYILNQHTINNEFKRGIIAGLNDSMDFIAQEAENLKSPNS